MGTFHPVTLFKATEADVALIAERMRPADRKEMLQWTGQDALWAVRNSLRESDTAYVAYAHNRPPLCIFGAKRDNVLEKTAIIWQLSTDAVDSNRLAFISGTRYAFERICKDLEDVEEFHNFVSLEYVGAIRWIEWIGGYLAMHGRRPGICGGVFNEFYIPNPLYKEEN